MGNGYVVAGYALIWASLVLYAWRIARRVARAERQLATRGSDEELEVEAP